jgi:hypothetical protein
MPTNSKIGPTATTVTERDGVLSVKYYNTEVVRYTRMSRHIMLDTGGYKTATTKARMNQTANQFGLPYQVNQVNGEWIVTLKHNNSTLKFVDNLCSIFLPMEEEAKSAAS